MKRTASEKQFDLKERWSQFRAENTQVRIRDAAAQLGVSEVELLVTEISESVIRLNGNLDELLQEF